MINQSEDTTRDIQRDENNQGTSHTGRATSGRGWHGNPAGHANAGRKGGMTVSQNREHMAEIGRKGGEAVSKNRNHMAEIGRKGGQARGESSPSAKTESARKKK